MTIDTGRWEAALDDLADAYRSAAKDASVEGAYAIQAETKAELSLFPHPPHTKTPSRPGLPPGRITGRLMDSVVVDEHPGEGFAEVGPTAEYGREQELGGPMEGHPYMRWYQDGRWYRSAKHSLPDRPYLKPATETVTGSGELGDIYYRRWAEAQATVTGP